MTSQTLQADIGRAQVAVRSTNEAIQASADAIALLGPIPFVCECADESCSEIVRMTFDEYEAVRQHPRHFFNISGHETPSVVAGAEKIVAVIAGDLTIVAKLGIAGAIAEDEGRAVRA